MIPLDRRSFLLGSSAFLLGACATSPGSTPALPRITFIHRPKLAFAVQRIDITDSFRAPRAAPHIEHLMPAPPAQVARQWAVDRLEAKGPNGLLNYDIIDASVRAFDLKTDKSLQGSLKTQADIRYEGRIEVRININTAGGTGQATAIVSRSQTALENLTLNERDELLISFAEALGQDLDRRLEAEIRQHLARFLV